MRQKILIAEDVKLNSIVIAGMLQGLNKNFELMYAQNGEEAYHACLSKLPDLVLMDWRMPVMNGLEALKLLKSNELTKFIPVIMTSAFGSSESLKEALDSGANDYIRKPIEKLELYARVQSALKYNEFLRKIREQNEQIVRQVEELKILSVAIKESDNSVIIFDKNGTLEWANDGFSKMYEFSVQDYISTFGNSIFTISNTPDIYKIMETLRREKHSVFYNSQYRTKDRNYKWIRTTLSPVLDDENEIVKIIAIETDISKLKKTEEELTIQNDDMMEMTTYLKELLLTSKMKNEEIRKKNEEVEKRYKEIEEKKKTLEEKKLRAEKILLSVLPFEAAIQLQSKGQARPRNYKRVSILFTDFQGFTKACESLTPREVVASVNAYFNEFDKIAERHYIEKIKTIGDAYMCAGGLPLRNRSNPFNVVLAGLEIQNMMSKLTDMPQFNDIPHWKLRLGIHSGPVVAGVVGNKKIAYDMWGDSVNVASRMESNGEVGKVNISEATYEQIKDYFDCTHRGRIKVKNRGEISMYFVDGIKPEFAEAGQCIFPNKEFKQILHNM